MDLNPFQKVSIMKSLIATFALILLTACAVAGPVETGTGIDGKLEIPVVPSNDINAQTFFLENGLEVLAVHNPGSPMVGLNLLIRVGSAYEDYSTSGMSHMLEHLLFNGSDKRTQAELYEEVDFYGAYSNAHTDMFYTNFIFLIPAAFLAEGMDIQTDMIFNSILPAEKFDKERGIVIEEIRKDRDRKTWSIDKAFDRMTYGSTGVGMPTIGTLNTIEHLSRDKTYEFYKTHYVPNNMVLTILGNFDPATVKDQLEEYYGKYQAEPLEAFQATAQAVKSGQVLVASGDADKIHGQVVFDVPSLGDERHLSYQVFTQLMSENETKVSYHDYPGSGRLIFSFDEDIGTSREDIFKDVVEDIQEIEANLATLITDDKISFLHKKETVEEISLLDSPHYYGMMKAGNVAYMSAAESVTRLNRIAALPAEDIINNVKGFSQRSHQFNLFTPAEVSDETEDALTVTTEKTVLPSGATLISRTSGGSNMFGMHILIKDRHLLEGELGGAAEILHGLLNNGTSTHTKEQIKDELAAHGATLKAVDMGMIPYDDYYNSADYGYIRFECLAEDAEWGIRFISQLMADTVIDEAAFEKAHKDATDRISRKKSTALHTASQTYKQILLGEEHPFTLSVSGTEASMEKIDLAGLQELQGRYFNPANFIITISSPLSHESLAEVFNSVWTTPGTAVERAVYTLPVSTEMNEKVLDLGKEQAQIRLGFVTDVADEDKAAFAVMTSILSYRMMFDLRETQGLAYRLSISNGSDGQSEWITATMGTGVEQVELALAGIRSYFDASRLDDVSQKEIDKTVNAGKGRYMMRNLTRLGQSFYMGYHEYYDGDYEIALKRSEKGETITPADVQSVAEKYLSIPDNYTLVVVK
jgi:predicted Zn-dependent peptidase